MESAVAVAAASVANELLALLLRPRSSTLSLLLFFNSILVISAFSKEVKGIIVRMTCLQLEASQSWLGAERKLTGSVFSAIPGCCPGGRAVDGGGQLGLLTWVPDQPCALGRVSFSSAT